MKFLLIFIFVFWINAGLINAQKTEYKIRAKNRQITVTYQGKPHILRVSDKIDAAKLTDVEIIFADRKSDLTYFLISAGGPSKEKSDDRQCGAGIEENLLWIKLDKKWQIQEIQSVLFESCWLPVMLNEPFQINGRTFQMSFDDLRENLTYKVMYNAEHPEKGLQIEKQKLEN